MTKNFKVLLIFMPMVLLCQPVISGPFSACPTEAFLVQDKVARLYGVQLATGFYSEIAPGGWTDSKLNALAFNFHDNYLYAFSSSNTGIVKIHSDFSVEELPVENLPGKYFYVGDIALSENAYYMYHPADGFGLYRIALDPAAEDYLNTTKITSSNDMNLAIYDMAFHPTSGVAYAVDRNGILLRIDVNAGSSEIVHDVGVVGTFGAAYFDLGGSLYISRNQDGHIFKIDVAEQEPTAQFYSYGPVSSNNDGARCAMAPVVSVDAPTIDFGNAPDSYGTSLSSNGARHEQTGNTLVLGQVANAEPDAFAESGEQDNDNDGVVFLSGFELGSIALIEIEATKTGYLNAWVDWDIDGEFEEDEQVFSDEMLISGKQLLFIEVPTWAKEGVTWSRFRASSTSGIGAIGGVSDGEVEDYSLRITQQDVVLTYYPTENTYATVAFEDNWPLQGDYDFNDLVVNYRLTRLESVDKTLRIVIEGRIMAMGAAYHNGFAIRIPNLSVDNIVHPKIEFSINGVPVTTSPVEPNSDEAILVIAEDLWRYIDAGESCQFYRSEAGCSSGIQLQFYLDIPLTVNVETQTMGSFPFDPFLFASPDKSRSFLFGGSPGKSLEIHLSGIAPTTLFDPNYFGMGLDASNPAIGNYYVNQNGMPWAINFPYEWKHPLEYVDITDAYPEFENFVTSGGISSKRWFEIENAQSQLLFFE